MKNAAVLEKLNDYNRQIAKHDLIVKTRDKAILLSGIIHILMLIPFAVNFYALTKVGILAFVGRIEFFNRILAWAPGYYASVKNFIIYALISLYVIPMLTAVLVLVIGKFLPVREKPLSDTDDLVKASQAMHERFAHRYYFNGFAVYGLDIILACVLAVASCYALWITCKVEGTAISEYVILAIIEFIKCGIVFFIAALILSTVLRWIQQFLCVDSTEWWKNYRKAADDCEALYKQLAAEAQAEKEEREKEKKLKAELKRLEQEAALAKEAEEKWNKIDDVGQEAELVEQLAEQGSPSACAYLGKELYLDYRNNSHTNRENKVLIGKMKKYLAISAKTHNAESEFLLLAIDAETESHELNEWEERLQQARTLKSSGELDDCYSDSLESLTKQIIENINVAEEQEKERARKRAAEEAAAAATTHTGSYSKPSGNCRDCKYFYRDVDLPWPVCKLHEFHFEGDYTACEDFTKN